MHEACSDPQITALRLQMQQKLICTVFGLKDIEVHLKVRFSSISKYDEPSGGIDLAAARYMEWCLWVVCCYSDILGLYISAEAENENSGSDNTYVLVHW
jgi:hypothetical protein